MDDIHLISSPPTTAPVILKPSCSPLTGSLAASRQRTDSAPVIQQSDVSSSRPALLAHDALGPLLFEALDGFFFTINHNCELDFVSDNVGQYLKFSQDELAGRNLYYCVHPSDVSEFSKAWAKKDSGDSLASTANAEQPQPVQSRGRTFLCRMRTNDESAPYVTMVVSVALHRDPSGSDKTFLICIARRPPLNELKEKPALLGFDQFSSRINLQYEIESLDSSHMKCETLDMNFIGRNFRDYVYDRDVPLIDRHFQEVVEKGEAKSAVYRFCLHDEVYAFVNTQSKLFSNTTTGKSESIMSTHTIVRLIDNTNDLNDNASTRLMKAIIVANRDLQKNKQQSSAASTIPSSRAQTTPPPTALLPPPPTSTPPIGTQFALTMLGMHKNAPNSLQQHVSSTLGTLIQVQNSLSAPIPSPNEKSTAQATIPSSPKPNTQRLSTMDSVSSTDTVEFGSKRTPFSPSLGSVHSNHGSVSSPLNSFDLLFTSTSPSADFNSFLPSCSPSNKKPLSPLQLVDPAALLFSNSDNYSTVSSPLASGLPSTPVGNPSRNSTRLRQLLATKSPPSAAPSPHYHTETKHSSNAFDDLLPPVESPSTTHSPITRDSPSPNKRRRHVSQTNTASNHTSTSADILLKQLLGRQPPATTAVNGIEITTPENNNPGWPSPNAGVVIKTEAGTVDESALSSATANGNGPGNKLRSDIFLRTLLNDEVRPQKVVVEAPFVYNSRHKSNLRASAGSAQLLGHTKSFSAGSRSSFRSQLSLQTNLSSDSAGWDAKSKRKPRQHSHSFGSRTNVVTTISPIAKTNKAKRDPTDYLLGNPQSVISDNSLDALFEPPLNLDQSSSSSSTARSSPIVLRRTTRQTSASNANTTVNLKRAMDNDDQTQSQRKFPKLLTRQLKEDVKIEYQDHSIISPSVAIAATRPLNQLPSAMIKTEPDIFERSFPTERMPARKPPNNSQMPGNQSTLLRTLIRTPQTPSLATKKDGPLYDLLQNFDANDSTSAAHSNNNNNPNRNPNPNNNSIDPFEQLLAPVASHPTKNLSKDDYLAALLSSDPQQPNEISFIPVNKQPAPVVNRSVSTSSDSSRIAAIVNDLFTSTTAASTAAAAAAAAATTATGSNNPNDDFLSLLDNRDFFECFNEPTAIDMILSQNAPSAMEPTFASTTPKRSEKDEKAISEIYKTLVTSFNPGPPPFDLPVDNSPFSSITGDFLFADNATMSIPPNRTVTADPSVTMYRQQSANYTYQPQQQQPPTPSNMSQFSDCLSMDMLDNTFPPNVSLSPMSASFLSPGNSASHMEQNNMMMYTQQAPNHVQHHQGQSPMSNMYYRQPSHASQQPMYNNFAQPQPPPPNQVASNYHSIQQQQQSPSPQRVSTNNLQSQMNKRQAMMQQQQQQQQRASQQTNQQLQLHMSMNVTLPHMAQNQQSQQQQQQQQQQQPPPQQHRQMMNTYNDLLMPNGTNSPLQQDFHQFSPSLANNNSLDLPYGHDLFMSPPPSGPMQQQQQQQARHMNVMQAQQSGPPTPSTMHQQYPNMSVAVSATIQQGTHNTNNLMNPSVPNLTAAECRQSEELNNQMMNCLSFQTTRCTSEFVRKQLQNTIHGRQKPTGGKDVPGAAAGAAAAAPKMMNPSNLDPTQKGAYFRSQLSSPISTPPIPTNLRSQQHQQQGKTTM